MPWRLFLIVLSLIFAAEAAVMLLLPVVLPQPSSPYVEAVSDACLLTSILAPPLWWLVIRPLRSLVAERSLLLARVMAAQEEERARIARELHDQLGQSLTCVTVGLRTIEEQSTDDSIRDYARELRRLGAEAHEEVRRLISGLRPLVLDDLGLAVAIENYLDDISGVRGMSAHADVKVFEELSLPDSVATALYRIVQEATTNAIRHGHAQEITVKASCRGRTLEVAIRDNGCGFDPQAVLRHRGVAQSFGLSSLRQRVDLLSGMLHIDSRPGEATTVTVRIPLPESGPQPDLESGVSVPIPSEPIEDQQ
jgi:signal transduction histidine kinase